MDFLSLLRASAVKERERFVIYSSYDVTAQVKTSEVCDRHSAHCDRRKRPGFHA